jgi:pimeloyl-ACP methyl ester carboxylesterase
LKVPLDYAAPSGETIDLAVSRRGARGQRIGALLINPGGPGGSALDFLASFVNGANAQKLLDRFDIVAFDPRGVGKSTPLDCHSTLQKLIAVDPSPDDEAEWTESDQAAANFAAECGSKYPKLLPHLATPNVARDMDQVRAALGEETISYLGFSYGTAIGAWYAELFPDRVRAMVLDGAVNLQLSNLDLSLEQAIGFEQALASYFAWCGQASGNCSWTGSRTPQDEFARLSAAVDATPLRVQTGDRPVGPGEFLIGVIAPLYGGTSGFRSISSALRAAEGGDGSALLAITDSYLNRRQDMSYGNITEANAAVNCLDSPAPSYAMLRAQQMRFSTESPIFGLPLLTGMFLCSHWSVSAVAPPPPTGKGASPLIVIGTVGDPATPYAWAEALASELESAVLLTFEGEGHTAYGRSGVCIDDAVNAYFLTGKVPAEGTRCPVVSQIVAPDPSTLPFRIMR